MLEAQDQRQLAKLLHEQGFVLVRADIEETERGKKRFSITLPFLGGVSLSEKLMFARNLRTMVSSGISFPKACSVLAQQAKSSKFKKALGTIQDEIAKGTSLSEALSQHPAIFSELFQSMVKAGEESGTLDESLKVLAEQLKREHDLKSTIQGAMIYPAVIITAMIGIGILMLVMVVPQLAETFASFDVSLPATTLFVIFLGTNLAKFWFVVPFVVVGLGFLFRFIQRTESGEKAIGSAFLKIPVLSQLVRKTNAAYTIRTLGSLLGSGVPIVRSLEITSGVVSNIYYKKALIETAKEVGKGAKLSESLRRYQNIYPPLVIQMIEVGEETGKTSDVLSKLAEFYEEEIGNATKNLASVIEPVLMLIIGGIVGFFAVSMIQPMYSMLQAIQ